jgi:hypothetical protein
MIMAWVDPLGNVSSTSNPAYTQDVPIAYNSVTATGTIGGSVAPVIPAVVGKTAYLDAILVSGTPLPATVLSAALTSTNLANALSQNVSLGPTSNCPLSVPLYGLPASAANTAITMTLAGLALVTLSMTLIYHYQ